MEFGSLGLGLKSQSASNQTGVSSLAQTATSGANPENTVTPVDDGGASQNDRRQDVLGGEDRTQTGSRGGETANAPDDLQLTSRRTTLNFDSEQNRIFLEIVDTTTDEVIEQIPSDRLVQFVEQALNPATAPDTGQNEEESPRTEIAV